MDKLPLAGADIKGFMGRYVSSIHESHTWAGCLLVSYLIHKSLTTTFLSCSRGWGTEREKSGPGLQMMSQKGCVSPFIK